MCRPLRGKRLAMRPRHMIRFGPTDSLKRSSSTGPLNSTVAPLISTRVISYVSLSSARTSSFSSNVNSRVLSFNLAPPICLLPLRRVCRLARRIGSKLLSVSSFRSCSSFAFDASSCSYFFSIASSFSLRALPSSHGRRKPMPFTRRMMSPRSLWMRIPSMARARSSSSLPPFSAACCFSCASAKASRRCSATRENVCLFSMGNQEKSSRADSAFPLSSERCVSSASARRRGSVCV